MLSTTTLHTGDVTTYGYDAMGIKYSDRIVQTNSSGQIVSDTTTAQLTDSMNPTGYAQVLEELVAGVLQATYIHGLEALFQNRVSGGSNASSYYLFDGHSGVRQVLSPAHAQLAAYLYDAFGNTISSLGSLPNPLRYRGEAFNATLSQYYLRARFYNPSTGAFTRMDPFAGMKHNPSTLSKYFYTGGDPIAGRDPTGLFTAGEAAMVGGITGALAGMVGGAIRGAKLGFFGSVKGAVTGGFSGFIGGYLVGYAIGAFAVYAAGLLMPAGAGAAEAAALQALFAYQLSTAAAWISIPLTLYMGLIAAKDGYDLAATVAEALIPLAAQRYFLAIFRFIGLAAQSQGGKDPDGLQRVTSWAEEGVTPDLDAGRWVQLGPPSFWNWLSTGLWGPKFYTNPIELAGTNIPMTNFVTGLVKASRVTVKEEGVPVSDFIKKLLGQRMLGE